MFIKPGPSCSKLMTLLVKISNGNITNIPLFFVFFGNAKDSHILSTKNNSVFAYEVVINLTSWGLKDDVKLTKF